MPSRYYLKVNPLFKSPRFTILFYMKKGKSLMRLLGEKPIYISFYDEKNEFFFFKDSNLVFIFINGNKLFFLLKCKFFDKT